MSQQSATTQVDAAQVQDYTVRLLGRLSSGSATAPQGAHGNRPTATVSSPAPKPVPATGGPTPPSPPPTSGSGGGSGGQGGEPSSENSDIRLGKRMLLSGLIVMGIFWGRTLWLDHEENVMRLKTLDVQALAVKEHMTTVPVVPAMEDGHQIITSAGGSSAQAGQLRQQPQRLNGFTINSGETRQICALSSQKIHELGMTVFPQHQMIWHAGLTFTMEGSDKQMTTPLQMFDYWNGNLNKQCVQVHVTSGALTVLDQPAQRQGE